MDIQKLLEAYGLIQDLSDPELFKKFKAGESFYCGFDPTAGSLHLGNYIPMVTMLRLAQSGYKPIMLFGGATGQIGDPSGRSSERPLLCEEEIRANVDAQFKQAQTIFDRLGFKLDYVNNADWIRPLGYIDFLREVGKYITVNYMTAKDSVKQRLSGDGLSYTEFSYMLIQAYDFLHLYKTRGCRLQIGGSDQWGNITCGLELIRKKIQGEAFALSSPLLTDSAGKKYGKSEGGAIWLNAKMFSAYKLHQFLLNTGDSEIIYLIKRLTLADQVKINELEESLKTTPEQRTAQKYLADTLTAVFHGESSVTEARKAGQVLFGGDITGVALSQLLDIFSEVPSAEIAKSQLLGQQLTEVFAKAGAAKSKGEARRLIQNGGAYLNNIKIAKEDQSLSSEDLIEGQLLILRSGKKNYQLIKVIND